jgi:amino acid transporter
MLPGLEQVLNREAGYNFSFMQGPRVFLREATGLVKEVSLSHILAFNLINISFGVGVTYVLTGLSLFPGGDPALASIITALLFVPLGIVYAMLLMATPRAGGDYVYVSRTLHPALGYVVNFTFIVWVLFWTGAFVNWIFTLALGPAFTIIGSIENAPAISNFATMMMSTNFVIAVGILVIVVLGLIATFLRKALLALTAYSVYAGVVSIVIMAIVLATNSQTTFINNFNAYAAPLTNSTDYYHALISSTHSNYTGTTLSQTVGLIPIAAFVFMYVSAQQIVGGEIKNVQKNAWRSMLLTFVIGGILTALVAYLAVQVMGYNFLVAVATTSSLPIPPYYNALIGVLFSNSALLWVTEILFVGWYVSIPMMNFFMVSRYLLASSMDGVTPGFLAKVSDRFHTPFVGIWIVVIVGSIMTVIYTLYASIFSTLSAVLAELVLAYLLVSIAAIIFPYRGRTKAIFEASTIRYKVAGVPVISIFGALSTVILLAMGYMMVMNSAYGVNSFYSLLAVVLTLVLGLAIFGLSYVYKKSRGLNILLAFTEIPPE